MLPRPDLNDAPLTMGKAGGSGAACLKGIIDEVRLSNVARTQEEIMELMNEGLKTLLAVDAGGKLTTTWGRIKGSGHF